MSLVSAEVLSEELEKRQGKESVEDLRINLKKIEREILIKADKNVELTKRQKAKIEKQFRQIQTMDLSISDLKGAIADRNERYSELMKATQNLVETQDRIISEYKLYKYETKGKFWFPVLAGLTIGLITYYQEKSIEDSVLWGLAGYGGFQLIELTDHGPGKYIGRFVYSVRF